MAAIKRIGNLVAFLETGIIQVGDGADYLELAADGGLTLHGTARVKRHISIVAARWVKHGFVDPDTGTEGVFTTVDFDKAAAESVHYVVNVPYRWALAADITAHVLWLHDAAALNAARFVRWGIEYIPIAAGETVAGSTVTVYQNSVGGHDADEGKKITTTFSTAIPGSGLAVHDSLGIRFFRDAINDDLNMDARMLEVHFEFTMDRLGEDM